MFLFLRMVFRLLKNDLIFPNPSLADEDGLLAVGGDLSPIRLKIAYENGIFPWFNEDQPIMWFSPPERCVIYPDRIKISNSLQRTIRSGKFEVTQNKAFAEVIQNCAKILRKDQDGTWIGAEMLSAYNKLHSLGFAQSIEVWETGNLVGGLYGIKIGRVFCGESMFSKVSDASKVALVRLARSDIDLIDCQIENPHLISMGAEMISRVLFLGMLKKPI
ncbi:leucyl/phenylalanyl-tRNA--protein transferase [Pedobacter sp. UYP30]|uniref:leucyl/phenylalanyl-tRNA--protein transferase n=1 Tax=Pedobacter sp. UYP30 TaxID=1756400 RepID=UPI003395FD94